MKANFAGFVLLLFVVLVAVEARRNHSSYKSHPKWKSIKEKLNFTNEKNETKA